MPLTNKQYDAIMREYDRRQYHNYRIQCARKDEIYQKIPRIREIEESISSFSMAQAEKLFLSEERSSADPHALENLRRGLACPAPGKRTSPEAERLSCRLPGDALYLSRMSGHRICRQPEVRLFPQGGDPAALFFFPAGGSAGKRKFCRSLFRRIRRRAESRHARHHRRMPPFYAVLLTINFRI